jgi:hypothetical protein
LLQLSNLDYRDAAFLPPCVGDADAASLAKANSGLVRQMNAAANRLEFEEAPAPPEHVHEADVVTGTSDRGG